MVNIRLNACGGAVRARPAPIGDRVSLPMSGTARLHVFSVPFWNVPDCDRRRKRPRFAHVAMSANGIAAVRCDAAIQPLLEDDRTGRGHRGSDVIDPSETSATKFAVTHKQRRPRM